MRRRSIVLGLAVSLLFVACSGSDGTDVDDEQPSSTVPAAGANGAIGGINGPAVVDPSFDPFATVPSAPTSTDGG